MQILCAVLHAFSITAIFGSALGDEEGGDLGSPTPAGGEHVCGIPLGVNQTTDDIPFLLAESLVGCLVDLESVQGRLNTSHTTEEYRQVIKDECDKRPIMLVCAAAVGSEGDKCLTAEQSLSFKVEIKYYETIIRVFCDHDGERVASIVEEVRKLKNDTNHKSIIKECISKSKSPTEDLSLPPSQISLSYYTVMQSIQECVSERIEEPSVLFNLFESIINDLLRQLMCVHPENQLEVPCNTLSPTDIK